MRKSRKHNGIRVGFVSELEAKKADLLAQLAKVQTKLAAAQVAKPRPAMRRFCD